MKSWRTVACVMACALPLVFFLAACDDGGGGGSKAQTLYQATKTVSAQTKLNPDPVGIAPSDGTITAMLDWKEGGYLVVALHGGVAGILGGVTAPPVSLSQPALAGEKWYVSIQNDETISKNVSIVIRFTSD